ncbi:MAG: hypothetical protein IJ565_02015 [Bacilli bacterium]|nr:hypothetical protein [Bacilli bacterium]
MNEELNKIIKNIKGTLLIVGVNNSYILDTIYKNKKLDGIYSLDRAKLFNKNEKNAIPVKLKKIKKEFKNNLDYMLCDVNGINIDLRKVLYNTYKLIDKKIIYYGMYDEYDVDRIVRKYKRFGCVCNKKMYGDNFILSIDVHNIKVTKLFLYKISDTFIDIIEGIGNLLVS